MQIVQFLNYCLKLIRTSPCYLFSFICKTNEKNKPQIHPKKQNKKNQRRTDIFFFKDGYKTEQVPMMMDFTER